MAQNCILTESRTYVEKSIIVLSHVIGLNRTGHMSVQSGQDRTPKFAGRVLPDRTKSGHVFFLVHTKFGLLIGLRNGSCT